MRKMSKTSIIGWIILIGTIGIALEILFNWRLFIPLVIGAILIHKGRHAAKQRNTYFIIGILLVAIPILSSGFLKLFIIAAIIYGLHEYYKTKKQVEKIVVHTVEPGEKPIHLNRRKPYFNNTFLGSKQQINEIYEWDDINIQCGFGDTIIDLGMTMLPLGESVVVIRSIVGNIQILVPFDVAVIINHSTLSGTLHIFGEESELFNANVVYYPDSTQESMRTIKIITNVVVGNIEVKRI